MVATSLTMKLDPDTTQMQGQVSRQTNNTSQCQGVSCDRVVRIESGWSLSCRCNEDILPLFGDPLGRYRLLRHRGCGPLPTKFALHPPSVSLYKQLALRFSLLMARI